MAYRYFSAVPLPAQDGRSPQNVTLDGDEAHHLIHVMRTQPGAELVLFDGSGAEFDARVVEVRKKALVVEIHARRVVSRESAWTLTLAVALPKGERQRFLVEKLVELGVAELVPLDAERSVAKAGEAAVGRLARTVVEASKQCGRNTLMTVAEPVDSRTLFTTPARAGEVRLIAHPGGASLGELLADVGTDVREGETALRVAIGPEGGFSDAEFELARNRGWVPLSLGPRILRTETAAVAIAARLGL